MLHSRHIVSVEYDDGSAESLYYGGSKTEAVAIRDKALESYAKLSEEEILKLKPHPEAVIIFSHILPSQIRRPAQEKIDARLRAEDAERARTAVAMKKKAAAAELMKTARQAQADATKLLREVQAS